MDRTKASLTVLARLAERVPAQVQLLERAMSGRVDRLVGDVVDVALETGGCVVDRALRRTLEREGSSNLGVQLTEGISSQLDALTEVRVWALEQRSEELAGTTDKKAELAEVLTKLACDYSACGDYDEARATARAAHDVAIDALAADIDSIDVALFAETIRINAQTMFDLADAESAAEIVGGAVELLTPCCEAEPELYCWQLARCQVLQAMVLERLEQVQLAGEIRATAIEYIRRHVDLLDTGATAERAEALSELGTLLMHMDRVHDAIDPLTRCVAELRELDAIKPGQFRAALAADLYNLGEALDAAERPEDALAPLREAIELHRALLRPRDLRLREELAVMLTSLVTVLSVLGRLDEAIGAAEEAVAIRRAYDSSPAYAHHLPYSLMILGAVCKEAGRGASARRAVREAAELIDRLLAADADPLVKAYLVDLKDDVSILAAALRGTSVTEAEGA